MKFWDLDRALMVLFPAGLVLVFGLWLAEDRGVLTVAQPRVAEAARAEPGPAPAGRLVLQGVIQAGGNAPGLAILAEPGRRPVLIPEGVSFNEDVRVEQVLADRVVLRQRGVEQPIVLMVSPGGMVDRDLLRSEGGLPSARPAPVFPESGTAR